MTRIFTVEVYNIKNAPPLARFTQRNNSLQHKNEFYVTTI